MFGQKTLAEIREELRSKGFDIERLRKEFTQSFQQPPRTEAECIHELGELLDILNSHVAAIQSGADTPHSKGSR